MEPPFPARFAVLSAALISSLATASLAPHAAAQAPANLSGYWDARMPTENGDGTFRHTYVHLEQSGDTITGELVRHPRGLPIQGSFHDGRLHFVTVPPPPPAPRPGQAPRPPQQPITFDGTLEGGKLHLTRHGREGVENSIAEKVSKAATEPPQPLPLPALHTVPDNGLARTPPMGWNSWNKFAEKVTDADVRGMADAMVSSGMRDAGYTYINIDDTWELGRDAQGNITTNKKFPDMKALAEYVHSKGLKIGLYSSPGPQTCALYEGSFGHVKQDAEQYAKWGFDYLKYDLCTDLDVYKDDAPTLQAIYQEMGDALQATHRPIVYSLCEYGRAEPWMGWGEKSGGNLWRTTGDIEDTWASIEKIGFSQLAITPFAHAGHWNDPDMLEIGNGGMTADEYRTHMSLWAMLAAPLIAGNDIRTMTPETRSILLNKEVIAIDQDPNYHAAATISDDGNHTLTVIARPVTDGVVVGFFNRSAKPAVMNFDRPVLPSELRGLTKARDLWKHADVPFTGAAIKPTVPSHGVVLLKFSAK